MGSLSYRTHRLHPVAFLESNREKRMPWKNCARSLVLRMLAGRFRFGLKDGFNRLLEHPGNVEGKRQAGIVLPVLNGVHGLPRYPELRGEVRLRPATLGTQN